MQRLATATLLIVFAGYSASPVFSQSIPAKGTDNTFDIATWNIEWFGGPNGPGDDELQIQNVVNILRAADIDLWALQEIADESDFGRLLDSLGGDYNGFLATQHSGQRIGFLYDTRVVRLIFQGHILESFSSDFASRPPLQMEAEITIGDSSRVFTFITIHMKAFSDTASYDRRLAASGRLKNHIDFTGLEDEPVILLGDFNDLIVGSITTGKSSPYDNFRTDRADYLFATEDLLQDGRNSWCSNSSCTAGSTIDHILMTNEVIPYFVGNSTDHFDELLAEVGSYTFTTSDHLPIFARFDIGRASSVEDGPDFDVAAGISLYPNPFENRFTVTLDHVVSGPVNVDIFDITGRIVKTMTATSGNELSVDLGDAPAGVYLVRVSGLHTRLSGIVVKY